MLHMYFHFQNITLSFFFFAITFPTVIHYLMSIHNLEDNWTRISGQVGFSLVIIELCRWSDEWPGQKPLKQMVTACLRTDFSPQSFPAVSQVWEYAVQASKAYATRGQLEWHGGAFEYGFSQDVRSEVKPVLRTRIELHFFFSQFLDIDGGAGVVKMSVFELLTGTYDWHWWHAYFTETYAVKVKC